MDEAFLKFGPGMRLLGHLVLIALSLVVILPMLLVVGTAFKPASEIYSISPWPTQPTLENFARMFDASFGLYLWNSLGTTVLRVSGQIVLAVLAAYGLTRWEFKGREVVFALVLG